MKKRLINILLMSFWSGLSLAQAPTNAKNFVLESTVRAAGHKTGESLKLSPVDSVNRVIKYMDGLGRPLQVVNWMASPNRKDMVQSFEYDGFGREIKKYLPYAEQASTDAGYKTNAGVNLAAFYGNGSWDNTIKQTAYPFSLSVPESSPLNRLKEQGSAGATWQPLANSSAGHTIKMEYGTNAENEVKLWVVNSGGASSSWWPAARLYKTVSKDENWLSGKTGTTDEFKDFEGKVLLKKIWRSENKSLSTYYVYDDLGNLRYVLPPAVNEDGQYGLNSFVETDHLFVSFIYGYHYDSRNRLLEKKVPGKGWEWIFSNKLDQVIITQDANQRNKTPQEGSFTKYDALGRVVITGVMGFPGFPADSSLANPSRQYRDFLPFLEFETVLWESRDNNNTETGYTSLATPQSNILDNPINRTYRTINYYDDYDFNGNIYGGPSATQVGSTKTKGLLTGTKAFIEGTTDMVLNVYYYDEEGRVIQTRSMIDQLGTDVTDNSYNFSGELISSLRTYVAFNQTTTLANRYKYDHQGRKTLSFSKINNQPEVTLSGMEYNELGQLKTKRLHGSNGTSFAQHTDFRYNERGWLKSSTSSEFSMELKYEDGSAAQFNGNISGQRWGAGLTLPNTYNYEYDKLNRLTKAVSTGINMSEELEYDAMGNISKLNRDNSGMKDYNYDGNRLLSVTGLTGNYNYDVNGNAVKDGRNGMDLAYNVLNLPVSASDGTNQLNYVYDGTGRKLAKYYNGNYRSYVDGIESSGSVVDIIHTEEGAAQNNGGIYTYQYNLSDHLGNVRYTFDIYGGAVRRLQSDDYYAFGKHKSSGSPVSLNNKYLYNGKEVQDELGEQYDYGARFYDPVIGRWNVIDPLVELYQESTSPYIYVQNNPILLTDPDGRYPDGPGDDLWNFVKGAGRGIATGAKGTVNFVTDGAWKAETWKATGNLVLGLVASNAAGPGGIGNTYALDAALGTNTSGAVNGFNGAIASGLNKLENGNAGQKGEVVGQIVYGVAEAVAGSKGAGLAIDAVKGARTAAAVSEVAEVAKVGKGTSFVVNSSGEAVAIPKGATGPSSPMKGSGMMYEGGSGGLGMDKRVTGVRIMDASATQGRRINYMNAQGQTVNPWTGRTIANNNPSGHIPFKQ